MNFLRPSLSTEVLVQSKWIMLWKKQKKLKNVNKCTAGQRILKTPVQKNSWNRINQFHEFFFNIFHKKLSLLSENGKISKIENSVKLFHFISRVFWPRIFKIFWPIVKCRQIADIKKCKQTWHLVMWINPWFETILHDDKSSFVKFSNELSWASPASVTFQHFVSLSSHNWLKYWAI